MPIPSKKPQPNEPARKPNLFGSVVSNEEEEETKVVKPPSLPMPVPAKPPANVNLFNNQDEEEDDLVPKPKFKPLAMPIIKPREPAPLP